VDSPTVLRGIDDVLESDQGRLPTRAFRRQRPSAHASPADRQALERAAASRGLFALVDGWPGWGDESMANRPAL